MMTMILSLKVLYSDISFVLKNNFKTNQDLLVM